MSEVEHAVFHVKEARPVHHIRSGLINRTKKGFVVTRIVFKVGILHDDDIFCGCLKSNLERSTLTTVFWLKYNANLRVAVELFQDLPRTVGRAIIDDDDLLLSWSSFNAPHNLTNSLSLVKDGDYNADSCRVS